MPKPADLIDSLRSMTSDELHDVAEAVRRVQIERALDDGDHDAIMAEVFDVGFAGDGRGASRGCTPT